MQTVLSQLNSVPGVIGSLACDRGGQVLGQAFPPLFDAALLHDAARVLADGAAGLEPTNDGLDLLDFRFAEARLSVKPFPGAMLLVLSGRATNVQFLNLSVSLAAAKLAKLQQAPVIAAPPPPAEDASLRRGNEEAEAVPARARRVAAPTRGLEELRRRLAGAHWPVEGKSERDSNSFALPIGSPAEQQHEFVSKADPKRTKG